MMFGKFFYYKIIFYEKIINGICELPFIEDRDMLMHDIDFLDISDIDNNSDITDITDISDITDYGNDEENSIKSDSYKTDDQDSDFDTEEHITTDDDVNEEDDDEEDDEYKNDFRECRGCTEIFHVSELWNGDACSYECAIILDTTG